MAMNTLTREDIKNIIDMPDKLIDLGLVKK